MMRKYCVLLVLAGLLVMGVCLGWAMDEVPLAKPDVLTEETVITSQRLSTYDTLIIKDLNMDNAKYERVDDEERGKIDAMKPMLNRIYQESLEMGLRSRKLFKAIEKNSQSTGKALILEGEIVEFNAGSRAMRFWVGFGAGKTYLLLKGRLLDAQSGKELATFVDRETGFKGAMSMERFEDLFPHQAKSMGENVATFIEKLY